MDALKGAVHHLWKLMETQEPLPIGFTRHTRQGFEFVAETCTASQKQSVE